MMRDSGKTRRSKQTKTEADRTIKPVAPSASARDAAGNATLTKLPSGFAAAFTGRSLWVCLGLILTSLAVYAPVWNFDFVDADDPAYLYENPQVSAGLTWKGAVWAFTTLHEANWHPLTWLSHMLDVQLFGMSPGPHHLINLVLHIANTLLWFGLLYWLTGMRLRSATVAALFALHPLHVESVAWLAERKDVLSTLFLILTVLAYVGYVRRPGLSRYLAVPLLFGLGLMAKPMLVTLPFLLLLLDFWPLRRIELKRIDLKQIEMKGSNAGESAVAFPKISRASLLMAIWEKVPLLDLSTVSSMVTYIAQQRGGAVHQFEEIPWGLRLGNALLSYVAYIGKMFWPVHLAVIYPFPRSVPVGEVLGALVLLTGVSVFAIGTFKRHPYFLIGWLWYLGTLIPVIGIVQVGGQAMADRYTYIPLIGLFIISAWGIPALLATWPNRDVALPALAGVALLLCAIASSIQIEQWQNPFTLWSHAVKVAPDNHLAHLNLGTVLYKNGKISEALQQDYEAMRIRPDLATTHNNLAVVLVAAGHTREAIEQYQEALRIKPDYADARNSLGTTFANNGQLDEAIQQFRECLKYKPDNAEAHANLGFVLAKLNRLSESEHEFQEALRFNPGDQTAERGLEILKTQSDRFQPGSP